MYALKGSNWSVPGNWRHQRCSPGKLPHTILRYKREREHEGSNGSHPAADYKQIMEASVKHVNSFENKPPQRGQLWDWEQGGKRAWGGGCLYESRPKTSRKSIRSGDSAQVKLPIPLPYLPRNWRCNSIWDVGPLKRDDSWTEEMYYVLTYIGF